MTQYAIEILLPVSSSQDEYSTTQVLKRVKTTLVDNFGGVTAYTRAPAEGVWAPSPGKVERDEVVIVEVMVDAIDEAWWTSFRLELERELQQDEIIIRAFPMRSL